MYTHKEAPSNLPPTSPPPTLPPDPPPPPIINTNKPNLKIHFPRYFQYFIIDK